MSIPSRLCSRPITYIYKIKTIVLRSRRTNSPSPVSLGRQYFNWTKLQGAKVSFFPYIYVFTVNSRRWLIIPGSKAEVKSFGHLSLARVYNAGKRERDI